MRAKLLLLSTSFVLAAASAHAAGKKPKAASDDEAPPAKDDAASDEAKKPAAADDDDEADKPAPKAKKHAAKDKDSGVAKDERPYEFSAGAKFLVGGGLFSSPSGVPTGYEGPGFAGGAGGIGWGLDAYFEARFWKYFGVELGVGYDHSEFHRNITMNGGQFDVTESATSKSLRVPLIFKLIVPAQFGRMSLGLGPEFVSAMTPDSNLTATNGAILQTNMGATKAGGTRFDLDFGFVFDLPANLELPIGLRASKALSQPDAWNQRVDVQMSGNTITGYSVQAETTWDFRLDLGLGYRF